MRVGFILLGALVVSRLLPLPPNSEPLLGLAVLSPYLSKNMWVWFAPLLVMLISDIIIGFHSHMLFTYTALAVSPFISKHIHYKYQALMWSWMLWHVMANFGQLYPAFSPEALVFDIRFLLSGLCVLVVYDLTFYVRRSIMTK